MLVFEKIVTQAYKKKKLKSSVRGRVYIRDVLLMIPMYLNWYLRPKIRQNGFSERDGMKSRRCLSYKLESCANVLLNVPVNFPAIIPKIYRKTYNVIKYIGIFSYFHWTPAITVSY